MGARVYNPTTGRFLTRDPVPGGSCSAYDYVCADPVNTTDINGCRPCWIPPWAGRGYKTYTYVVRVGAWTYGSWTDAKWKIVWDIIGDFTVISIASRKVQYKYRYYWGYNCEVLQRRGAAFFTVRVRYMRILQVYKRERYSYRLKATNKHITETSGWFWSYGKAVVLSSYVTPW